MSNLSRCLERIRKDTLGEKLTILEKMEEAIDNNRAISCIRNWYYSLYAFFHNLPMFLKFAWGYRSWDYSYNVGIFADLLEDTAKNLREHGNHVNSEKHARRAFASAGMLRKAYDNYDNKTMSYLYKKNGYSFLPSYNPVTPLKILNGMRKAAMKREDIVVKQRKADAWQHVNKYIESYWN